jgi:hypothetical protein
MFPRLILFPDSLALFSDICLRCSSFYPLHRVLSRSDLDSTFSRKDWAIISATSIKVITLSANRRHRTENQARRKREITAKFRAFEYYN